MSAADLGRNLVIAMVLFGLPYLWLRPLVLMVVQDWQRGKAADRKTIVDLATPAPASFAAEILDVARTRPRWSLGPFDSYATPGYGDTRRNRPLGATSTLPAAESNDSPPRRGLDRLNGSPTMKPATPKELREIANDPFTVMFSDRERLRLLADAMEKPYSGAPTGDVIARFVGILADNINACQGRGLTTVVSPLEARKLHAAIIEEGMQTAESLTKAGLVAVRAEDRANEMAGLVDEQARLISSLRRAVLRLTDRLKTADDERVEVKFVFVPDPLGDPSAMGVEEAMDLALALDAAK